MPKRKREPSGDSPIKWRSRVEERDQSPELDQSRPRDPSPELGLSTPPPARKSTYEHLNRSELQQLLRDRGLTPQLHNRRNKHDFVRRLIEFDQQYPSSPLARTTGQFSPRSTQRELREALKIRGLALGQGTNRKKADLLRRLRESEPVQTAEEQTAEEQTTEEQTTEEQTTEEQTAEEQTTEEQTTEEQTTEEQTAEEQTAEEQTTEEQTTEEQRNGEQTTEGKCAVLLPKTMQ